jgi:prephenate dehydrogenase
MNTDSSIQRLALIGVGLIGGSLVKSLKHAGVVHEVVGVARTRETVRKALDLGVIDRAETEVEAAVAGADMVVIATPMQAIPPILGRLDNCIGEHTVVTDVGSVKHYVVAAAEKYLSRNISRFVPGHPIAGRERAGVEAASLDLFSNKSVVLTPAEYTEPSATERVSAMWRYTGATVQCLDAGVHDRMLAATSHLPHIVAYALVDFLAQQEEADLLFGLAAAGFYDFTRIASSDPVMWRDICLTNRDAIVRVLEGYRVNIDRLLDSIQSGDGDALHACFARSRHARDRGLKNKQ